MEGQRTHQNPASHSFSENRNRASRHGGAGRKYSFALHLLTKQASQFDGATAPAYFSKQLQQLLLFGGFCLLKCRRTVGVVSSRYLSIEAYRLSIALSCSRVCASLAVEDVSLRPTTQGGLRRRALLSDVKFLVLFGAWERSAIESLRARCRDYRSMFPQARKGKRPAARGWRT